MSTCLKKQRCSKSYYYKVREVAQDQLRRKEARFKRQVEHREKVSRAFADFCEATDGEAYYYVNNGVCSFQMAYRLAYDGWAKKTAARYYKISGKRKTLNKLPRFKAILASLFLSHFILLDNTSPAMSHCALALLVKLIKKAEANINHRALRPRYYERENMRRKELAHERRRIIHRTTTNSCPDKEAILDAYMHRKDSKEAAIHFGSLIHDLECYVDNDLRFEGGRIVGRNTGIKGWLRDNIPVLESQYSTIMRYKAMAKKLKQLVELDDPIPAEAVLTNEDYLQNYDTIISQNAISNSLQITTSNSVNNKNEITVRNKFAEGAKDGVKSGDLPKDEARDGGVNGNLHHNGKRTTDSRENVSDILPNNKLAIEDRRWIKILKAIAIYKEVVDGVVGVTQLMARIDAFLDPERIEYATTLAMWREKYKNEITVRNSFN